MLLDLTWTTIRWTHRRHTWRPLLEPFDPTRLAVEPIVHQTARAFGESHHYSQSFPVALAPYGLFERTGQHRTELVGVAVFSVPVQPRAHSVSATWGGSSCSATSAAMPRRGSLPVRCGSSARVNQATVRQIPRNR